MASAITGALRKLAFSDIKTGRKKEHKLEGMQVFREKL